MLKDITLCIEQVIASTAYNTVPLQADHATLHGNMDLLKGMTSRS